MHKHHRNLLFYGSAAIVTIGLTATGALAATRSGPATQSQQTSSAATWSVFPNIPATEGGSSVGPVVLTDTTTGNKITCTGADGDYTVNPGMHRSNRLATVFMQIGGCTLPGGATVTLTPDAKPWVVAGATFDPGRNLGVTGGRITGVDINLSSSSCNGVLDGTAAGARDGSVAFQYYNNPHWLVQRTYHNSLRIFSVSGCAGIFNDGDAFTFSGTLTPNMTFSSP